MKAESWTPVASHLHLWSLPDGTGLHAPVGELVVEEGTCRLCCHLCGGWYVSLGAHVRAHGHTAETYRATMGLCTTEPLTSTPLSTSIATRQAARYRRDVLLRDRLDEGRRSVQSAPRPAAPSADGEPVQRQRRRAAALAAGRSTVAVRREQELTRRLTGWGHTSLHDYLRCAYSGGASLGDLAQQTGLGRARLHQEMQAAGITTRPVGSNSASAKRSRAMTNDLAAADRVGAADIHGWLAQRHSEGWSLSRLARAVGHSSPWVAQRLPSPPQPTRVSLSSTAAPPPTACG